MKTLGQQLGDIITRKFSKINAQAAPIVADAIAERMKENTQSGKGFGNDRYDNVYSKKYANRAKQGVRTPVTLRAKQKRIENTKIQFLGEAKGSQIQFVTGGEIFRYHHEGIEYKNGTVKMRSVFPKTAGSVSRDIKELAQRSGAEVLSGAK